jgi:hypothetical protein
MIMEPTVLYIAVDPLDFEGYGGHNIYINNCFLGYRRYSGHSIEEIKTEVCESLAELLREKLGWPIDPPSTDF